MALVTVKWVGPFDADGVHPGDTLEVDERTAESAHFEVVGTPAKSATPSPPPEAPPAPTPTETDKP